MFIKSDNKKTGKEAFRKRGYKVESKKKYTRKQKHKNKES